MNKNILKPTLNDISHNLYNIINNNNTLTYNEKYNTIILKDMINKYYENIEKNIIYESEKLVHYNNNINIPRINQLEHYYNYLTEREEVYNEWLKTKNPITIHKLATFKKFEYNNIPNIFTSDIEINKNFKYNKSNNDIIYDHTDKNFEKDKTYVNNIINDEIDDIEEVDDDNAVQQIKEDVNEDIKEDVEEDVKDNDIEVENKCTDKKIKECIGKGKICNPKSGRCIINNKQNFDNKKNFNNKEKNLCTDKKIKECIDKDKICNPKTGRCNKK